MKSPHLVCSSAAYAARIRRNGALRQLDKTAGKTHTLASAPVLCLSHHAWKQRHRQVSETEDAQAWRAVQGFQWFFGKTTPRRLCFVCATASVTVTSAKPVCSSIELPAGADDGLDRSANGQTHACCMSQSALLLRPSAEAASPYQLCAAICLPQGATYGQPQAVA